MENSFTVNIQLTRKDYERFLLLIIGKRRLNTFAFTLIIVFVAYLISITGYPQPYSYKNGYLFIVPVFFIIYFKYVVNIGFKKDVLLQRPQTITFNAEALTFEIDNVSINCPWPEICKFIENKEIFVVYLAPKKYIIIPKRFLTDEHIKVMSTSLNSKTDLSVAGRDVAKTLKFKRAIYLIVITISAFIAIWQIKNPGLNDQAKNFRYAQKYAEALVLYNQLIENDKNDYKLYEDRAECENKLGKYEDAIKDCFTALKLNANTGFAYYQLAIAQHLSGNSTAACESLKKATANGTYPTKEISNKICNN